MYITVTYIEFIQRPDTENPEVGKTPETVYEMIETRGRLNLGLVFSTKWVRAHGNIPGYLLIKGSADDEGGVMVKETQEELDEIAYRCMVSQRPMTLTPHLKQIEAKIIEERKKAAEEQKRLAEEAAKLSRARKIELQNPQFPPAPTKGEAVKVADSAPGGSTEAKAEGKAE